MVGVIPGLVGQPYVLITLETSFPDVTITAPEQVDLTGTLQGSIVADRPLLAANLMLVDARGDQHAVGLVEDGGGFAFTLPMQGVAPGPASLSTAVIDEAGNPGAKTASLLVLTDAPYFATLDIAPSWAAALLPHRPYRMRLSVESPYEVVLMMEVDEP